MDADANAATSADDADTDGGDEDPPVAVPCAGVQLLPPPPSAPPPLGGAIRNTEDANRVMGIVNLRFDGCVRSLSGLMITVC